MFAVGLSYIAFIMLRYVPSIPAFWRVFIINVLQPLEWEKIIANEATDKQLISKIYKQPMQLPSRKINDPIKQWDK